MQVMRGGGRVIKSAPARFDATGMSVRQHFATSLDGTRVPFFVVGRDLEKLRHQSRDGGRRPLILYGYGAHGEVLQPSYNGVGLGVDGIGTHWLSKGGLFAV